MVVGSVAFQSIGFHAAMILNRLKNEKQIAEGKTAENDARERQRREAEETRAKLKRVNKRLRLLNLRVEPMPQGGKAIDQTDDV